MKSNGKGAEVALRRKISKSILFPDTDVDRMADLALELRYTRYQDGVEVADVSKLVQRAVRFMLDNPDQFKGWLINGG